MKKYNDFTPDDFTFVVCAYKECKYLEESIRCLINQTQKAHIVISTSTPNKHIVGIADKYGIEVRINPQGGQIEDYNFAMEQGKTKLIMLAHQDEIIKEQFVEKVIQELNYSKDPIIAFTNYVEIHNDVVDESPSIMVRIKRFLLLPAKSKKLMRSRFGKRLIQRFGDPITHPTVVCVKDKMPKEVFRKEYIASMDWDLWERLSMVSGSFVYVKDVLLYHRMNENNQSSVLLKTTNIRYENEYAIFCRFWPRWMAKVLTSFYSKAGKYY